MKKRVKVDKDRLNRFDFKPVEELKIKIEKQPELRQKLREDFTEILRSQGITIDEDFKQKIRTEWRSTIKQDIRKVVEENPDSDKWYLSRVLENKPIRIRVKIDKETGEKKKTLRRKN